MELLNHLIEHSPFVFIWTGSKQASEIDAIPLTKHVAPMLLSRKKEVRQYRRNSFTRFYKQSVPPCAIDCLWSYNFYTSCTCSSPNRLRILHFQVQIQAKRDSKPPIADSSKTLAVGNNTMTEHEIDDMLFKGIKPKIETKETLTQFVRWRIQAYEQHKWDLLSDIFAEEFQQFAKEDFEILSKETLYSLRTCLRVNGVYVRKGRGVVAS